METQLMYKILLEELCKFDINVECKNAIIVPKVTLND